MMTVSLAGPQVCLEFCLRCVVPLLIGILHIARERSFDRSRWIQLLLRNEEPSAARTGYFEERISV